MTNFNYDAPDTASFSGTFFSVIINLFSVLHVKDKFAITWKVTLKFFIIAARKGKRFSCSYLRIRYV